MLFYMIFGTNLEPSASFCFFLVFEFHRKGISNGVQRNETFGKVIFGTNVIQRSWSGRQERSKEATMQGGAPTP